MADAKKEGKKNDKKGSDKKGGGGSFLAWDLESTFFIIIVIAMAFVVVWAVARYFGFGDPTSPESAIEASNNWSSFKESFTHFAVGAINTVTFLSIFISLMLIMAAYYSKFRKGEIVDEMKYKDEQLMMQANLGHLGKSVESSNVGGVKLPGATDVISGGPVEGPGLATVASAGQVQWRNIQKYMQSHNPSDWRLAILEADILLYDMLDQIGFEGDTIGDKLKSVNPASFNTLDNAWQAHKIRNLIAHEGSNFELNYAEARKAVTNYQKVFDEFYFI